MECIIYTDGASKGNPGRGGWGALAVWDEHVTELGGREDNVTNNKMELRAAIEALTFARSKGLSQITVYSDSKYVIDGITKWIFGWKKNGWKTKTGGVVVNADMWQELFELVSHIQVTWKYTGGHIGVAGNERVDQIASDYAEGKKVDLYAGPLSKYTIDILNISHNELAQKAKTATRSRSKLQAYSYVSEVDGVVKTHKTWGECESRVKGKPARFKKATSAQEEKNIISEFSSPRRR